jgi:hypothetical protein
VERQYEDVNIKVKDYRDAWELEDGLTACFEK